MKATFKELTAFSNHREAYLKDSDFRKLQELLMENPNAGPVIEGTGGLRKVRLADTRRGKGKRGGVRVIYYWCLGASQFWLFTLYDKDEVSDLTKAQKKALKLMLKNEEKEHGEA